MYKLLIKRLNKFYKLPTNTKVDIKKLIEIKDSEIEKRDFTIQELGNILFEMYSNICFNSLKL